MIEYLTLILACQLLGEFTVGAMIGPFILNLLKIKDWAARGFAIGTASHGIGTARALQVNELSGAFSGLAMGLNALATAIVLLIIWNLWV